MDKETSIKLKKDVAHIKPRDREKMPRRKKPKLKEIELFKNEKHAEEFFDIIFGVGKQIYDNVTKNQETPKPQEQNQETHIEPMSPTPQETEIKVSPPPVVEVKEKSIIPFKDLWKKERCEISKRLG